MSVFPMRGWALDPKCFLCGGQFQFSNHVYAGRLIRPWNNAMACRACEVSNWDGIVADARTLARFTAIGVKPIIDNKGLIQWPPQGA